MSRDVAARLTDILEAIERIRYYDASVAQGTPPLVARDAIAYRLVVIGEAVKDVPEEYR